MPGKLRSEDLHVISGKSVDAKPGPGRSAVDQRRVGIEVKDATLHYPLGSFVRGSLKSGLFRALGHKASAPQARFVDAMSNMNLSVQFGERVGIVGANGSGKSTLLRALAGVYPLKHGSITVQGQIGTLLDIGLGFENESTGRENIYYRGMAMGHSRRDIARAEAEIIAFADLGDFIDLPMRTYSSGMYVRLGFAVSTQFKPDVLLVDEVFGAGDAAFSERAEQRMMRMVEAAGIMMLATHDLLLVQRLCTRALWINHGQIVDDGAPAQVCAHFGKYMLDAGR